MNNEFTKTLFPPPNKSNCYLKKKGRTMRRFQELIREIMTVEFLHWKNFQIPVAPSICQPFKGFVVKSVQREHNRAKARNADYRSYWEEQFPGRRRKISGVTQPSHPNSPTWYLRVTCLHSRRVPPPGWREAAVPSLSYSVVGFFCCVLFFCPGMPNGAKPTSWALPTNYFPGWTVITFGG